MGHPPFLLSLENGVIREIAGDDSRADYRRLLDAPAEALTAYMASRALLDGPCAWLDVDKKRCRHYSYRPDICRTFEIGGKWCTQFRVLHQIE